MRGLRRGTVQGAILAASGATLLYGGLRGLRVADEDYPGVLPRFEPKDRSAVEIRRAVTIDRSIPDVYRFLHDAREVRRALEHVEDVQVVAEGITRWRLREGRARLQLVAELVEDVPNRRIAFRTRPGSHVDADGELELRHAPGNRGTELRARLRLGPSAHGPLLALEPLLRRLARYRLATELGRMKQLLETGEIATAAMHGGEPPWKARTRASERHARRRQPEVRR